MKDGKFRTLIALVELDHETGGRLLADLLKDNGKAARKLRKLRAEVEAHPLGRAMLQGMGARRRAMVAPGPGGPVAEVVTLDRDEWLAALPAASSALN